MPQTFFRSSASGNRFRESGLELPSGRAGSRSKLSAEHPRRAQRERADETTCRILAQARCARVACTEGEGGGAAKRTRQNGSHHSLENMSHLFIDADDTLWENNIYFENAFDDFVAFLGHSSLTHAQIRDVLNEIE